MASTQPGEPAEGGSPARHMPRPTHGEEDVGGVVQLRRRHVGRDISRQLVVREGDGVPCGGHIGVQGRLGVGMVECAWAVR